MSAQRDLWALYGELSGKAMLASGCVAPEWFRYGPTPLVDAAASSSAVDLFIRHW